MLGKDDVIICKFNHHNLVYISFIKYVDCSIIRKDNMKKHQICVISIVNNIKHTFVFILHYFAQIFCVILFHNSLFHVGWA